VPDFTIKDFDAIDNAMQVAGSDRPEGGDA
jgi:hypothetical protein